MLFTFRSCSVTARQLLLVLVILQDMSATASLRVSQEYCRTAFCGQQLSSFGVLLAD